MQKEIKHKCEVDYMCQDLNQLSSYFNYHIENEIAKNQCNEIVEKLRANIDQLRSWGHNLRKQLIVLENQKTNNNGNT